MYEKIFTAGYADFSDCEKILTERKGSENMTTQKIRKQISMQKIHNARTIRALNNLMRLQERKRIDENRQAQEGRCDNER